MHSLAILVTIKFHSVIHVLMTVHIVMNAKMDILKMKMVCVLKILVGHMTNMDNV